MRELHVFNNYETAAEFCDSREDAIGVVSNSPAPGQWTVSTGHAQKHPRDMTAAELFEPLNRALDKQQNEDQQVYEGWLLALGTTEVAEAVAAERGLSGPAACFFEQGFKGVSAAFANPRAEGLEAEFRQGRRAKEEKGMSQRCRAAAAALRSGNPYSEWSNLPHPRVGAPVVIEGEG